MSRPPWISARGAVAWAVTLLVGAFVVRNFEHVMEQRQWHMVLDDAYRSLSAGDYSSIVDFMTSDIMIGVAVACFVFGFWDVVSRIIRSKRESGSAHALLDSSSNVAAPLRDEVLTFEYRQDFNHERSDKDGNRWITVRIKCSTGQLVQNAKPWLYSVKRHRNGRWSDDLLSGMPVVSSWPGSGNRFEQRPIYDERFILLLDYSVENHTLSFVTDNRVVPQSLKHFLNDIPAGKYWLRIGVESDNFGKQTAEFVLDWFGPNEPFELLSVQRIPAGPPSPT